jgi:signal transduction histidine kinase
MRINMDMIRTRLGANGDAEIRRRNDDSIELIESTFKAVENVMYELRPPMLEEYGVVAALQWLGRQFSQRTGIHVDVHGDENERCTPEVELAAYRIVQEALTNISRHSHATRVAITVHAMRPKVLIVEDNGVGFEAGDPDRQAGYGMITMRERAEAVGGKLEVRSAKGTGTRIVLTLPVRHP